MKSQLSRAIARHLEWISRNGTHSLDQYDFWATSYGQFAKGLYYRSKALGGVAVAPIFLLEILWPGSRRLVARRRRFPIADAHLVLGHLNMHHATGIDRYLEMSESVARDLLGASLSGYHGHCWGYPFDWMTTRGLWKAGTPLITTTPYCFEAFLGLYERTKREEFADVARSILDFSLKDLNATQVADDAMASSYSPLDHSKVMNASAYRAFVLIEGYRRFGSEEALRLGEKLVRFVLMSQQTNGSWLYGIDHPNDAFVDNFHTCFVLKNLYKCNRVLQRKDIASAIHAGHRFYADRLVGPGHVPKPFARVGRLNWVAEEMYDYAEGISLGHLLAADVAGAREIAVGMTARLIERYQLEDGHFATRKMRGGLVNTIPYMRWPQAQIYHALTTALRLEMDGGKTCAE